MPAFLLEDPACDLQPVIQPWRFVRATGRYEGAGFWLGRAEYDAGDAGVNHRADAHQAWLDGDEERRAGQPIVADYARGGAQRHHLGVCCRIHGQYRLIEARAHDAALEEDDGAYGHFAGQTRSFRFGQATD